MIEQGEQQARTGDITAAVASFRAAQDKDPWLQDPRAGLDPQRKAEILTINGLLDKGTELARQGKLKEAAGLFAKVKGLSENFYFEPTHSTSSGQVEKAQAIYNEAKKQ